MRNSRLKDRFEKAGPVEEYITKTCRNQGRADAADVNDRRMLFEIQDKVGGVWTQKGDGEEDCYEVQSILKETLQESPRTQRRGREVEIGEGRSRRRDEVVGNQERRYRDQR